MATKVLTAALPEELADKVDDLAVKLNRPKESIVSEALSTWMELEGERHRLTLEGLADVDAGRLVDHEAIPAWAESLGTAHPLPLPQPKE
jgi:predicted transcriptional regulator